MDAKQTITRLGVDTGGTFTDLILVKADGVATYKLPSTPDDPSRAVLEGVAHLLKGQTETVVFHGSTVATNALLEGKGADVGLLMTRGFADLIDIGRQNRPSLYALEPQNERKTLTPDRTFEVNERLSADGTVLAALNQEHVEQIVQQLGGAGITSVALVLLHSYANPEHEQRLAEALRKAGIRVSASHEILAEYREFERASTTVVNAMVSPIMERYLDRLEAELAPTPLKVMQSNGGSIIARTAGREAVRTILSGPAGGMVGAFQLARASGQDKILTFDMGGTSTDVGLCEETIPKSSETVIAGWPVKVPMIDIHTVGAGGGSIARIDAGGALRVGPESAGADPGPVCYGRGVEVTVTDANLYLGRLLPETFLGGRMRLNAARCQRAVETLAHQAQVPPHRLAEGILEVAEATMSGALRVVSVAKGYDPRPFTLVPFGGAGGLHACRLAESLSIRHIMIPPSPGLLSAVGMVLSDAVRDYSQSILLPGDANVEEIKRMFAPLEESAHKDLEPEQIPDGQIRFIYSLDMRYCGQSYEVEVPFGEDVVADFHRIHDQRYGYQDARREVEFVNLRLRAVGDHRHQPVNFARPPQQTTGPEAQREIWVDGAHAACPVYSRTGLGLDACIRGPALIYEETATHLLRPGWTCRVDERGSLVMETDNGR